MLKKGYLVHIVFFSLLLFWPIGAFSQSPARVVDGVLDAQFHDFEHDGPIPLKGEWEFIWSEFAGVDSFNRIGTSYDNITVPSSWNGTENEGVALPGHGYGTYHARVLLPEGDQQLALKILDMGTSCEIFVNGVSVYMAGKPGTSPEETEPGYHPSVVMLSNPADKLDIVVHVANYNYRLGGMWEPIILGRYADLSLLRERTLLADAVLFGCILIMGLYHLTLFVNRRDRKSTLWFGLFCLVIASRIFVTGERYIIDLLPSINWFLLPKLEYLTFFLAVPPFALYVFSVFPEESRKWITTIIVAVSLGFSTFVAIAPPRVFTHILSAFQIFTFSSASHALAVIALALHRKRTGAASILVGFIILFIAIVNDILYAAAVVQTFYTISFGLLAFLFFQAIHIAGIFNKDFQNASTQNIAIQEANIELDEYRNHLEALVYQRTEDLEFAKKEAEAASVAKSEFLASMSHELRTPLNHIIGFVGLVVDERLGDLSPVQKEYLADTLSSAEHLLHLINEILDIAKVESGTLQLSMNDIPIPPLVDSVSRLFREQLAEKQLSLDIEVRDAPDSVYGDERHLKQVLINLIANAVKFSPENSRITVDVSGKNGAQTGSPEFAIFCVADSGIGIDKEDQDRIFDSFEQVDGALTRAHGGTGLGLSLTKSFVLLHGGQIWVESEGKGKGSTFSFTIPTQQSSV